jgi:hypothetical protein
MRPTFAGIAVWRGLNKRRHDPHRREPLPCRRWTPQRYAVHPAKRIIIADERLGLTRPASLNDHLLWTVADLDQGAVTRRCGDMVE